MKLLLFTQKVDKNDAILGFFHRWIVEFSKNVESLIVICLYEGEHDLPSNVSVFSLGKNKGFSKFSYILNLYKYLYKLNGKYDRVFVHMNPIYLVLCGPYFFLKKIPVFMWYTHRQVDIKLRMAAMFSKKIFSAAKESFTLNTEKVLFLGHGIDVGLLKFTPHYYTQGLLRIAHIGRITEIKNIDTLINAVYLLKQKGLSLELVLYGGGTVQKDIEYKKYLERIIEEKNLRANIVFAGNVKYEDLSSKLENTHITVNLAPTGGMDKVVLESILLGIPAFACNEVFTPVFGEYASVFMFKLRSPEDLASKIYDFICVNKNDRAIKDLDKKVRDDFSLSGLIYRMVNIMK